ncbi:MAG: O-antigen ligase family protein [Chloroflexota bacterium]|nr:O-antigen ligase family protein [Chloroflexota bacterium]
MLDLLKQPVILAVLAAALVVGAVMVARQISRRLAWDPAGPIALIAAAPLLPHVAVIASVSFDDLLPLVGLGMLAWRLPVPRLSRDPLVRGLLVAVLVALAARVASALANGGGLEGTVLMLGQAIARPVVLFGMAAYVAATQPTERRQRFAMVAIASIGSFEAVFGLIAFVIPLPGGIGLQAAREMTSVYGVCRGLINGTLGLSANHLGAVFVLSLPLTVALAVRGPGWVRWGWLLAASAQSAALLLTFTRSSIYITAALAVLLLIYQRRFLLMAAVLAVTTVALLAFSTSVGCAGSGASGGGVGSLVGSRITDGNDRLALWYAAAHIMVDHPIYGVGLDRMQEVLDEDPVRYERTPFGPATSSAHNTILLAGAETGLIGGLAMVVINVGLALLALRCVWRGWRRRDVLPAAAGLVITGYLVQGMFNNLFSIPGTSSILALLVGAFAISREVSAQAGNGSSAQIGREQPSPYTRPAVDTNEPAGGGD